MSKIDGWYYLHVNHDLIYKRDSPGQDADIRESDFATALWAWDGERATAWQILVEALSLGAKTARIEDLAEAWGCDEKDAITYAISIGAMLNTDGKRKTACRSNFSRTDKSPVGFGNSYLEALADLCKKVGFVGGKLWNASFHDIMRNDKTVQS